MKVYFDKKDNQILTNKDEVTYQIFRMLYLDGIEMNPKNFMEYLDKNIITTECDTKTFFQAKKENQKYRDFYGWQRRKEMKKFLKKIPYIILTLFLLWGVLSYIDIVIHNLSTPKYSNVNLIYLLYNLFS